MNPIDPDAKTYVSRLLRHTHLRRDYRIAADFCEERGEYALSALLRFREFFWARDFIETRSILSEAMGKALYEKIISGIDPESYFLSYIESKLWYKKTIPLIINGNELFYLVEITP